MSFAYLLVDVVNVLVILEQGADKTAVHEHEQLAAHLLGVGVSQVCTVGHFDFYEYSDTVSVLLDW